MLEHLGKDVFIASRRQMRKTGVSELLGDLTLSDIKELFSGIRGPAFSVMHTSKAKRVIDRLNQAHAVVGGFCFLEIGMITATKVVRDRNGRKMRVHVDLQSLLKEPLLKGGKKFGRKITERLNGADLNRGKWKLAVPAKRLGIPLEMLLKAVRYFEISRAAGTRLKLVIPTYEYSRGIIANARVLGLDQNKVAKAVENIGETYRKVLRRLQKRVFPDVRLEIVLTHSPEFRRAVDRFVSKHPTITTAERAAAQGVYVGIGGDDINVYERLYREESEAWLRLFAYFFSAKEPTIFMLHGRDLVGEPLRGLIAAEKVIGREKLRSNLALFGLPGGPILRAKDPWPLLIERHFGTASSIIGERDKYSPKDSDARTDGYYGGPADRGWTRKNPPRDIGIGLNKDLGRRRSYAKNREIDPRVPYLRALGPYFGIPQEKLDLVLQECKNAIAERDRLFRMMHRRIRRTLHRGPITPAVFRRRLHKRK